MRHGLYRWILGLALALPGAGWGQPASQVPVTPYTINLLKAANQSNAWYALGIGASNQTQVTNWITTPGAGSVGSSALGSTALSLITNAAAGAAQVATNDLNTALVAQIEAATNGWVGGSGTNILPLNNVWTGDSNVFSGAVSAAGFIGDLTGTATWADYADSAGTTAYADEAQGAHELINGADEVLLAADSTNLTVAAGSRLVGDGSGLTGIAWSGLAEATTNAIKAVAAAEALAVSIMPTVVVYTNGSLLSGGVVQQNPGTLTSGIQEAINALTCDTGLGARVNGGTILLMPGVYTITTNIYTPACGRSFSLSLRGAGPSATLICYTGTGVQDVMTVGRSDVGTNMYMFQMRDLCMSSSTNMTASLLKVYGNTVSPSDNNAWSVLIENCRFKYGTNTMPIWNPSLGTTRNLIGVMLDGSADDTMAVRGCFFATLNCGISVGADWAVVEDCTFQDIGNYGSVTNDWATTSPYNMGASVLFREHSGGTVYHGQKQWRIRGNGFVLCGLAYANITSSGASWEPRNRVITYNDMFEAEDATPIVATKPKFTLVDPKYWAGKVMLQITNATGGAYGDYPPTSFVNWNKHPSPTNLVSIIDWRAGTNSGVLAGQFSGTFTGDGGGVTNLNASYLASGTIPAARFAVGPFSNWVDGAYSQVTSNTVNHTWVRLDTNCNFYMGTNDTTLFSRVGGWMWMSNVTVSADKDWNGKALTNVGTFSSGDLTVNSGGAYLSDGVGHFRVAGGGSATRAILAGTRWALASDGSVGNLKIFTSSGLTSPASSLTTSNINLYGSITATNGLFLPQLVFIPTNSIPASSSVITNYVLINLTNVGPVYVATNYQASDSFILAKPTLTLSTWP